MIESARGLIRDRPQDLGYHGRLATALVAMSAQQFEAAGEFFDLAIQAKPDTAGEVLLTWGLGLLIAEQYKTAAVVLRRAIDHPDLAEQRATFNYYLAGALEMDGQTEEALAAARKAVELDSDSPSFRSRIPWILYHAQRDEAAAEYKKLVDDLEKENGTPRFARCSAMRGWCCRTWQCWRATCRRRKSGWSRFSTSIPTTSRR